MSSALQQAQQHLLAEALKGDGERDDALIQRLESVIRSLQHTAGAAGAGAGHLVNLRNDNFNVTERLFAPFPEGDFPLSCSAAILDRMLREPPAACVPGPHSQLQICLPNWTDQQHPLFEPEITTSAPILYPWLHHAVCCSPPLGHASELMLTPFWNDIGMVFPERIGHLLGLNIVIDRNVEEQTVTQRTLKRDYMCKLEYRPCIVGEDKSSPHQQQEAMRDVVDKYKTVNAATYGRLGYILAVVMAGKMMSVYGIPLRAALQLQDLVHIIPPFEVISGSGRTKAVKIAINLTRWIVTVAKLQMLAPSPPADLGVPLMRPSPYCGADSLAPPGKLTIHFGYVDKTFAVPSEHLQQLLSVYGLLRAHTIPNAISCRWLHVAGRPVQLQYPMPVCPTDGGDYQIVSLRLEPVGGNWSASSPMQLFSLTTSLLTTLRCLHALDHVHRDIRHDNILTALSGWMLIDWELAAPKGSPLFWPGPAVPPGMSLGTPWEPRHDIWQLGLLLRQEPLRTAPVDAFAQHLLTGQFASASDALDALRTSQPWQ